jgi:hypothetical protein
MELSVVDGFVNAWPYIQPAISTVFGAVVSTLFLRKNTSQTEIEKIKQAKFANVADTLLDAGVITHLEYYKCKNFTKIAEKADKYYAEQRAKEETETKPKQINIDWFVRFFEDAGNVSDEMMQELWAKILAGEVKQPGRFSLRTLETLKNMSQEEARALKAVAPYAMRMGSEVYVVNNVAVDFLLQPLFDVGIFSDNDFLSEQWHFRQYDQKKGCVRINDNIYFFNLKHKSLLIKNFFLFSKVGMELLSLQKNAFFDDLIIPCISILGNSYPKLQLTAHRKLDDGSGDYDPEDLLEKYRREP